MRKLKAVNDFVIKFANVNGTGSASANNLVAKAIFRMGIPVAPRNIFPSNIQGLPTWYEIRVSQKGSLGRRGGVDLAVSVNPESMASDIAEIEPGGYFLYDSTKPLDIRLIREDITFLGVPFTEFCQREYTDARQRLLFKNMIYVGALAALIDIDFSVFHDLVETQFKGKERLITPNMQALELGYKQAQKLFDCPIGLRLARRVVKAVHIREFDHILMDGNTACALGAIYGGATFAAWYPITPSTSIVEAFERYAKRLRIDPGTGKNNFAILQAEDELAAIGMVIGANWNGARAFTATSGPGLSLMSEFLGLAYYAEVPMVLIDVQRAGPSTGMPTRTQQSDVLAAAYASHGDTKQVLLFPATAAECFSMTVEAFDLAEQLQTPVIMLSDLDLGMNETMSPPLYWDDDRRFKRGKVLDTAALEEMEHPFGRYRDVDGDAIPYRTLPGTHPNKGAFITRGTSRDEYAFYTENGAAYVRNMSRLLEKLETAKQYVPAPKIKTSEVPTRYGMIFFGTTAPPCYEAEEILSEDRIYFDTMRLRAFPFNQQVEEFVDKHEKVFVVEQNRDGQMRRLLINECEVPPEKLISVVHFDGLAITARSIAEVMRRHLSGATVTPIRRTIA